MAVATAHKIKMASRMGGYVSSMLSGLGSLVAAKPIAGGANSRVRSEILVPFSELERVSTTLPIFDI